MMNLSHLLINVGDNPDRPRPGRQWLRNIYQVHQRLCMAFPTQSQRERDPLFIAPYPDDGFSTTRFLFRVEEGVARESGRVVILVQSATEPDWDYAFQNAPLLAAPPETRAYDPVFSAGEVLRFRIRMNLSKKSKTAMDETDLRTPRPGLDAQGREKSQSKRVSVNWKPDEDPEEVIREWFAWKATRCGFTVEACRLMHLGWDVGYRPKKGLPEGEAGKTEPEHRMRFRAALLEGTLKVSDAMAFAESVRQGIGAAKAFGFGLLSLGKLQA